MTYLVLGIESSCDDTSAAIVSSDKKILSNIVHSQFKEHLPYKGVVPEIASRAHMNYMDDVIKQALLEANITFADIDAIAATGGPGLIGGVIVGTMYGKALASFLKKPYIAVNHLEGHALAVKLTEDINYPYLLILLSGGHCQFLAVENLGKYHLLGQTMDDALGEAYDKVAKMLGLDYPGGPIIEKYALSGDINKYILPKPICDRSGCDMSFSGLKTAVRNIIEQEKDLEIEELRRNISASFQYTILQILEKKISEAIKLFSDISNSKNIVISGGVAANKYLTSNLSAYIQKKGYKLYSPPMKLCTDNAAMIGWVGVEKYLNGEYTTLDFCPRARWPLS